MRNNDDDLYDKIRLVSKFWPVCFKFVLQDYTRERFIGFEIGKIANDGWVKDQGMLMTWPYIIIGIRVGNPLFRSVFRKEQYKP